MVVGQDDIQLLAVVEKNKLVRNTLLQLIPWKLLCVLLS